MKNLKPLLLIALIALGTLTPQQSHGALLFGLISGQGNAIDSDEEVLMCLLLLPICLLDAKGPTAGLSHGMLLNNGYSEAEAQDIMKGYELHRSFVTAQGTDALRAQPEQAAKELERIIGMPRAYIELLKENGL